MLYREIREQGYPGGISQLKAYLAPYKQRPEEPLIRFETPPGKQMQVDFTTIRRGRAPLKAFVATLGYSRATYVLFSEREDSEAWLTGLREAFAYFGGVPEEALFDNAGAIITERDAYGEGEHRWHPALAALADEYGFRPKECRPFSLPPCISAALPCGLEVMITTTKDRPGSQRLIVVREEIRVPSA